VSLRNRQGAGAPRIITLHAAANTRLFDHRQGKAEGGRPKLVRPRVRLQSLDKNQVGWDWFSLQLTDGRELMLYQLRLKDGGIEPYSSGTLVDKQGRAQHLRLADFRLTPLSRWTSPQTGASYPTRWRVTLPKLKINLEVTASLPEQDCAHVVAGSIWLTGKEACAPGAPRMAAPFPRRVTSN
jgi:hypothetical protein